MVMRALGGEAWQSMSRGEARLGFWTSVCLTILGAGYIVIMAGVEAEGGIANMQAASPRALWAGVDTLLTAAALVVLVACLTQASEPNRRVPAGIAWAFTILFAAAVCTNRFTQLGIVRQSALASDTQGLERFMPYGSRSVFFGLEMLGWGGFMSVAALAAAWLFGPGRLERWITGLLIAYALLGFTSLVGYLLQSPIVMAGFLAWGPVLAAVVILVGWRFWREGYGSGRVGP